jgi:hypothetical protein
VAWSVNFAVDSFGLIEGAGVWAVAAAAVNDAVRCSNRAGFACGGFKNRARRSASRIKGDLFKPSWVLSRGRDRVCQASQAPGDNSSAATSGSPARPKLVLSATSARPNPANRIVAKRCPARCPARIYCLPGEKSEHLRTHTIVCPAGLENMSDPLLHNGSNTNSCGTAMQGERKEKG